VIFNVACRINMCRRALELRNRKGVQLNRINSVVSLENIQNNIK